MPITSCRTISTCKPPRRLPVTACHQSASTRQSLAPGARTALRVPRPRHTRAMHVACTHGPSEPPGPAPRIAHVLSPPSLCPPYTLETSCGPLPSLVRIGSAVRPSTHQRARRDRPDAHLPSPLSIALRSALRPTTPPYRPEGTETTRLHTPTDRPSTQRRHERAAAPRVRSGATLQHPHTLATHACMCIEERPPFETDLAQVRPL